MLLQTDRGGYMPVTLSVPLFAVTAVENFSNGFNTRGTRGYNRGYITNYI